MKLINIHNRHIILTAILILSAQVILSQGTAVSLTKHKGLFMGVSFGPSQSQIVNVATSSVSNFTTGKSISFNGMLEIGVFTSKNFGITSGIGYNSYKSLLTLDSYSSDFITTDSENESYERRVSGSNIREDQKVGLLSIPLCLNLRIPFGESVGMFIQGGAELLKPVGKTYSSTGTFTFKGYYSAYNVLLENLPAYGFPTNQSSATNGELELKPISFDLLAAAGLDFSLSHKMQLAVMACYSKSLSSISNYSSTGNFQLSGDINQINSLMEGSSKTTIQSLGARVSLRYYFK